MEFWVGGAGYTVWLLDLWPLGAHKLLLNHTDSEYTFGIGFSCEKINVSISKSKTYGNPIPKVVYLELSVWFRTSLSAPKGQEKHVGL